MREILEVVGTFEMGSGWSMILYFTGDSVPAQSSQKLAKTDTLQIGTSPFSPNLENVENHVMWYLRTSNNY